MAPRVGAAGYLVYRDEGGSLRPLDFGGGDVLAVPAGPYADTSGEPGRVRRYAVAAVADGASAGPLSEPVAAAPVADGRATVTVEVGIEVDGSAAGELERPWEPMIGSEHMSSLLRRDRTGGRVIGTDHFEELGAPPELFHGGFGLLSVGNVRKPRYWALDLLARLGRHRLGVDVTGDGAEGLVEALAARHDDGRVAVLVWNVTLDQGKIGGDPLLDRRVLMRVAVPPGVRYEVRHYRIDAGHSNIVPASERMRRGAPWPSDDQWAALRELNRLEELGPPTTVAASGDGLVELAFDLPMPGVSYLELVPLNPLGRAEGGRLDMAARQAEQCGRTPPADNAVEAERDDGPTRNRS